VPAEHDYDYEGANEPKVGPGNGPVSLTTMCLEHGLGHAGAETTAWSRLITLKTVCACHLPPFGVATLRASNSRAIAPADMYGRPPVGKSFFGCFSKRIRCGHVSGLCVRCIDRWP
jgi:hypothetical protein